MLLKRKILCIAFAGVLERPVWTSTSTATQSLKKSWDERGCLFVKQIMDTSFAVKSGHNT